MKKTIVLFITIIFFFNSCTILNYSNHPKWLCNKKIACKKHPVLEKKNEILIDGFINNSKADSKFENSNILKQVICKGINAEISVEKNIYTLPNQTNYYLKFAIKNISKKKIGIDLTNSIKQFYPNFWCFYCSINEGINEGRLIQPNNNYEILKTNFNNGKITIINVNEEIHYYRNICKYEDEIINFNGIFKQENFFRIRLDGQLIITNGNEIEEFRLDDKSIEKRILIFNLPILKRQIPIDENQFVYKIIELRP